MKWIWILLATCFQSVITHSQVAHEIEVELLGKELAQQAIARGALKLAVFDFMEGEAVTTFSKSFSEELRIQMAVRNSELTIVDRAATDRVMDEQRLSSSPLFDENKAATVGKLVSAEAIVTGSLVNQAGKWRVTAKLISVETGAVIGGYATWLESQPAVTTELRTKSELLIDTRPTKRFSFHVESSAGVQWVNQAPAAGAGFVFSRMKYRGEIKSSRFDKGVKGFSLGVHYFAGLPVSPNHDYILGYRMVDSWTNPISVNSTEVYQDSYFLIEHDLTPSVSYENDMQATVPLQLYKVSTLRVDRLRVDLAWRYSLQFRQFRLYAEPGFAYSRQMDRSGYTYQQTNPSNGQLLTMTLQDPVSSPELPSIVELKCAIGAERGRWGIHLEGAVTTRNRNFMSPLDMFHHPEMLSWSSMQTDLLDDGVGEVTQKSSSENWYYWLSSIIQVRYQL
jgi:TolB-like protein